MSADDRLGVQGRRNLLLADEHPADRMVDGIGVGTGKLERHVGELRVFGDDVERLPLDDLVAEHVHQAPLLEAGPHAAGRFARLGGDRANFFVVVGRRIGDRLFLRDPLENEVFLERPCRARHHGLP
jgi:hypothetical protein